MSVAYTGVNHLKNPLGGVFSAWIWYNFLGSEKSAQHAWKKCIYTLGGVYSAYQWPGAQVIEWLPWPCHSSNFAPKVPKLRLTSLSPSLDQEPPLHHIVHLLRSSCQMSALPRH